ncbi:MAG: SPOR domain-containing protein [Rickettsiales bacterium]
MSENDDYLEHESKISKWIPPLVLISAIVGFVCLAWYAYDIGKQSATEEDLLVIEASDEPIKEVPLDPGGMKFPNQDKTVFDTFSKDNTTAKVERIMPPPEEPVSKKEILDTISSKPVDDSSKDKVIDEVSDKIEFVDKKSDDIADKVKIDKEEPAKQVVEKKVEKLLNTGKEQIQLGAYTSKAEAVSAWKKISGKFSSLKKYSPVYMAVNVKGKTLYRLRVKGFPNKNEASYFCRTLSKKGQPCFYVK